METAAPRATPRVPLWIWDAVGAALIVGSAFGHYPGESGADRTAVGFVAVLLPAALVMLRRRWPWVVLGACVLCFGVAAFTFPGTPLSSPRGHDRGLYRGRGHRPSDDRDHRACRCRCTRRDRRASGREFHPSRDIPDHRDDRVRRSARGRRKKQTGVHRRDRGAR